MADTCSNDKIKEIDLLIGNDYYWDIICGNTIFLAPQLYLIDSKLGWILSGKIIGQIFWTCNIEKECDSDEIWVPEKNSAIDLALIDVIKNSHVPPWLII